MKIDIVHDVVVFILLGRLFAIGSPQEDADAAIALAKAKTPNVATSPQPSEWMVTWIGNPAVWMHGVASQSFATLQSYQAGDVTVSGPWHNGRHVVYATLQTPTLKQIETALAQAQAFWAAERKVSPRVLPKAPAIAERDLDVAAGPWPKELKFPLEMKRYKRAEYTQSIAVTNGRDRITPVHRSNLNAKWHQSGGLEGIEFRSDLYRYFPEEPQAWIGDIGVLNSFGYMQDNRGWKVLYADGTKFMDVLSANGSGSVFEVRKREKVNGQWQTSILFTDEKARPSGYKGLTVSCNSCHNSKTGPGTGGYSSGLVPGGDTVFSVGFRALEK